MHNPVRPEEWGAMWPALQSLLRPRWMKSKSCIVFVASRCWS